MDLLQSGFEAAGIMSDGRELVAASERLDPDVVVLDISMQSVDRTDADRRALCACSPARVVFLTIHRELAHAARALEAGASGFVLKQSAASELVAAIQEALKGGTYITPQIASQLFDGFRHGILEGAEASCELTPRQREVLQLVAEGRSAKQIAAILHISPRTAEYHKARLMETLGVENTAELIQYAIRTGVSTA
jgi:DNA-binding NarL/FixJ family response regulator